MKNENKKEKKIFINNEKLVIKKYFTENYWVISKFTLF